MSHNVKLNFQPLPNLPYVQGYPGIIGSPYRKPPAVQGLLEVRVGKDQIKAKQIQIEFIQVEHLPGSTQVVASPIGSPINVWSASNGAEWEYATNADYKFYIPLPLNLPGSVELKQKGGAIRYELQANFYHKPKSGLLRKENTPITQVIKPIYIGKMELLAAWPIYNIPEVRQTVFEEMELIVSRPYTAFGPGDRIEVHARLRSSRPKPLKVRALVLTLHEILTVRLPVAKGAKPNAINRGKVVHENKININEKIARSEEIQRTIPLIVPPGLVSNTVRNGRAIELQYELSLKAVMEGMGDPKIEHMTCIIGIVPRARAHDIVKYANASLQMNRNSYYGNPHYANPSTVDLTPIRSRPQSSFVSRPLSADASSLYSRGQSQSEISSLRDPRAEYFPGPRSNERPQSYATFGQSSNEFLNPPVDPRRMTYLGPGGYQPAQTTRSSSSVDRPEGPIRVDSYNSQVESTRSREAQELLPALVTAKGRLSTDSKSVYTPSSPRPMSFVHTDAGRVMLSDTGQPVAGSTYGTENAAASSADQSRWAAAETEKQKLYIDARRRAALTQLAGGGELISMGLDEPPAEQPPSYSARDPVNPEESSSTATTVTSPGTRNTDEMPGAAYTFAPQQDARRDLITLPDPSTGVGLGIHPAQNLSRGIELRASSSQGHHSTGIDEKERMRLFFEQRDRQDISSRPSASSLGHASVNSSVMAAPPSTADGARSGDFLSAENEKDMMRRRYEAATRAVSYSNTGSVSSRDSFLDHSTAQSPTSSAHDHSHSSHVAYHTTQSDSQLRNGFDQVVNATASLRVETDPVPSHFHHFTAEEEKNSMRRRYEEAIAATATEASPSSTGTVSGPSRQTRMLPSSQASPSEGEYTAPDNAFGNGPSFNRESGYLTATQEKEQMRRRYENAMQATHDAHRSRSPASEADDCGHLTQPRVERQNITPPPLPAKPPELEQYKAILASPTQEMANLMYINSGMVPYPMMYPGGVPGMPGMMDYSQMMNGYYPQRGGPYQTQ
ncbi:hypothetical protein QFC21_000159 [Naganishia friedmannii]|uniref:Uncharacterized protein n=1 Tax=Naganishia friedmannii TaxID=89922 RepID=A0ACC2WCC9_9TREE|nr:hypothetical protein QFC21_000159 [Naganishia friedmannii]